MEIEQGIERESGQEPVFLPKRLMESCDEDTLLALEVLQDFQDSTPARLCRLDAAVASLDPALVRLEAHSLKGSCHTIGAEAVAVVCARMETAGKCGDLSDVPMLYAEVRRRLQTLDDVLTAYLGDSIEGLKVAPSPA